MLKKTLNFQRIAKPQINPKPEIFFPICSSHINHRMGNIFKLQLVYKLHVTRKFPCSLWGKSCFLQGLSTKQTICEQVKKKIDLIYSSRTIQSFYWRHWIKHLAIFPEAFLEKRRESYYLMKEPDHCKYLYLTSTFLHYFIHFSLHPLGKCLEQDKSYALRLRWLFSAPSRMKTKISS